MRRSVLVAPFLALACFCGPATAQQASKTSSDDVFARGCGDDRGIDRCADSVQKDMRARYNIAAAQELVDRGVTFRRVMLVDGYGQDVVAITAHRSPGSPPMVEVQVPAPKGDAYAPLQAVLDIETWERVLADSANFDRDVAPLKDQQPPICLHAWFAVSEAGDAARLSQNIVGEQANAAGMRRDAESACGGGLGITFAFRLADIAYAALPECRSIERGSVRNIPALLATCKRLQGDRPAAGEALATLGKLQRARGQMTRQESDWLLSSDAKALQPVLWSLLQQASAIYFDSPRAIDVDHVVARGKVVYWNEPAKSEDDQEAEIELDLIRQLDRFVIKSLRLADRRPAKRG
ncbi:hypothetical protein [Sphingomonas sp.]|uniref:hypothetical protein n=1 Tax=Sphingomonas sp. TaxID=28214 RepID=UPI002EDB05B5